MKHIIAFALLAMTAAKGDALAAQQVMLLNGTATDITLERDGHSQDVHPGSKLEVTASQLSSLRFGQEQVEYGPKVLRYLSSQKKAAVQAQPNGCLYLVPRTLILPMKTPPKQPAGFPICPFKRIALT